MASRISLSLRPASSLLTLPSATIFLIFASARAYSSRVIPLADLLPPMA